MAVVPRKRKGFTTYYAVNEWQGKQASERIGTSKRQAEIRDREMKREIKAGTYRPKSGGGKLSFRQWVATWRLTRKNRSAKDELRWLDKHVLREGREWFSDKAIDEISIADVVRLIRDLQAEGKLEDKSIRNLHGVVHIVFRDARFDGRCGDNPADVPPGVLPDGPGKKKEIYTVTELVVLVRKARIWWPVRVLNALCLLCGMREGEACGLNVGDVDTSAGPLWSITIDKQYDAQPLKTDRPRVAPVHPELRSILERWLAEGFELYTGRKPTAGDPLVPRVGARSTGRWTRSTYYKAFIKACAEVGVRARSLHATRHTFITLARRASGRKDLVEKITHNAKGDIVDQYTHFDWLPLCEVVLSINLDVHPDVHSARGITGNSGPMLPGSRGANSAELPESAALNQSSIPGASTPFPQKTSLSVRSRQEKRQESTVTLRSLKAANTERRRRLLALAEADPDAARPGLAFTAGLEAAYRIGGGVDHDGELLAALTEAAEALGLAGGVA